MEEAGTAGQMTAAKSLRRALHQHREHPSTSWQSVWEAATVCHENRLHSSAAVRLSRLPLLLLPPPLLLGEAPAATGASWPAGRQQQRRQQQPTGRQSAQPDGSCAACFRGFRGTHTVVASKMGCLALNRNAGGFEELAKRAPRL